MKKDWNVYLLDILRYETESCRSEIELIKGSTRYRVGGWVLEALPLSPRTLVILLKLMRFYFNRKVKSSTTKSFKNSTPFGFVCKVPVVVFGSVLPDLHGKEDAWCTEDAGLLAQRIDRGGQSGTLVVRALDHRVLRRLERARQLGWHVIWHPQTDVTDYDSALVAYVRAHVDECREVDCT